MKASLFFSRRGQAFQLFEPVLDDEEFGDRDFLFTLFDHEESFTVRVDVVVCAKKYSPETRGLEEPLLT